MTRLKIALMAGGDSPERGIALQSAAQIEAALDHTKYDITVIDLHHRDWHYTAPDGREWQSAAPVTLTDKLYFLATRASSSRLSLCEVSVKCVVLRAKKK